MLSHGGNGLTENLDHYDYKLTEKLLDERTSEQLVELLDKLENINFMLEMLEGFFRRAPEILDSINELVLLLRNGINESETMRNLENAFSALQKLQSFLDSPEVQELFKSDVLDVRAVQVVGKVSRAMMKAVDATAEAADQRVGLVGLMRMLTDPEVQPALQFILQFSKQLSKELKDA